MSAKKTNHNGHFSNIHGGGGHGHHGGGGGYWGYPMIYPDYSSLLYNPLFQQPAVIEVPIKKEEPAPAAPPAPALKSGGSKNIGAYIIGAALLLTAGYLLFGNKPTPTK